MKHRKPTQRAARLKARRERYDRLKENRGTRRPGSQNPHKGA